MDAAQAIGSRDWIGEPVKVAEFKEQWTRALEASKYGEYDVRNVREGVMNIMSISESALKALEEDFRPSLVSCGQENVDLRELPANSDLMTVKLLKKDLHKRKQEMTYRFRTTQFLRRSCPLTKGNLMNKQSGIKFPETERVPSGEVVLLVQVFRPIKRPIGVKKVRIGAHTFPFRILTEVSMLGCQTLTELRAVINCISDNAAIGDFSENPDRPEEPLASEIYKSGFFYIGDTFYNVASDPSCRDYSQVIIDWAKDLRRNVGPFKKAIMEDVRFHQLEIRLGYPYVYKHQGSCEHLLVFSEMRMHHCHDSQHLPDYPYVVKKFPVGKHVFCMLCRRRSAKWVTFENERVYEDPFFFCDLCFRKFNYTADNKKIGKFRALPYLDWNAVS